MKSIRRFLLTRLVGGSAVILAAAGTLVFIVAGRSFSNEFDRGLIDRVQGFASILFQHDNVLSFEFSDELMPDYLPGSAPSYFDLRLTTGEVVEISDSLEGSRLEYNDSAGVEPRFWNATLPDGRAGRFVLQRIEVHHVYPEEGPDRPQAAVVDICIARGIETLLAARKRLLLTCLAGAASILALTTLVTWLAVARGLAPARTLARALDSITGERLPSSLGLGAMPSELQPVKRQTDELLQRLGLAFERERRTSANIAHELRTPISEVLTVSEVALRHGDEPQAMRTALRSIRDVGMRMARSIATLLQLSRVESGTSHIELVRVDAQEVVERALASIASIANDRELRIENEIEHSIQLMTDRTILGIVVANLLVNAACYASRGSSVRVAHSTHDAPGQPTQMRLTISNPAPDLDAQDALLLAEPFWRKDGSRADQEHAGLGLALSHALAERAGLSIEFDLRAGWLHATIAAEPGTAAPDSAREHHATDCRQPQLRNAEAVLGTEDEVPTAF